VKEENLPSKRSTLLRKNNSETLYLSTNPENFQNIFIINGSSFKTEEITSQDLLIEPANFYMIINNGETPIHLQYNKDISNHKIIYDPYKYENSSRTNLALELFLQNFEVPKDYIEILPKWYSFKFTYYDYNLIFVRPEFGLSIQIHKHRDEFWEILEGNPIIINGNNVHHFVENGTKFLNKVNTFHSVINPNLETDKFVIIKERWEGEFDETDITRIFNPNQYY
jgi:mannose-6-phosphate isomerase-like protein (cupin superfamily)